MPTPATCGTEQGFERHLDLDDAPCARCHDAHAVATANRRQPLRLDRAPVNRLQYRAALLGSEPAEALVQADRHRLVAHLHRWGWTDARIAEHCRMTAHTTWRIRDHLGLTANRPGSRAGAA